jgi:hypothetical protein
MATYLSKPCPPGNQTMISIDIMLREVVVTLKEEQACLSTISLPFLCSSLPCDHSIRGSFRCAVELFRVTDGPRTRVLPRRRTAVHDADARRRIGCISGDTGTTPKNRIKALDESERRDEAAVKPDTKTPAYETKRRERLAVISEHTTNLKRLISRKVYCSLGAARRI